MDRTTFVISLVLIISGTVVRTLGSPMKDDYPEEHSEEYPSGEVREQHLLNMMLLLLHVDKISCFLKLLLQPWPLAIFMPTEIIRLLVNNVVFTDAQDSFREPKSLASKIHIRVLVTQCVTCGLRNVLVHNDLRVEKCGYVLRTNMLLTNVTFFIQELEELRSDPATNRYPEMIPSRKVVISFSIHMMMFVTKKRKCWNST